MRLNQVRSPREAEKPAPSIAERSLPRGCAWTRTPASVLPGHRFLSCSNFCLSLISQDAAVSAAASAAPLAAPQEDGPRERRDRKGFPPQRNWDHDSYRGSRENLRGDRVPLGRKVRVPQAPPAGRAPGAARRPWLTAQTRTAIPGGALRSRRGLTVASPFPPRLPAGALALDTRSAPRTGQPFVCSCCPAPGTPRGRGRGFPAQGPASQAQHRPGGVRASPERQL